VSALLWLLRHSFRNWIKLKVSRLKKPKYAVSAVVLGLYLCMILVPWAAVGATASDSDRAQARPVYQILVTGFLLTSFLWAWLFGAPGALAFSMPEAVFLFPAPVSRRALLAMKIVRSQLPILVSAFFFTFARASAGRAWFATLAGNLLVLEAIFLDRLSAALVQCPRPATEKPPWWSHLGKVVAILVIGAIAASFRPVQLEPSFGSIISAVAAWGNREPACWVLAPFRAFAQPALAHSVPELLSALALPGAIVLGLLAFVLLSNVPFEESALGASELLKQRIDLIRRTGKLRQNKGPVRAAPVSLAPRGGPVLALAWKNYLGITRTPLTRVALYASLGFALAVLVESLEETRFMAAPLGGVAAWVACMATIVGPDALRSDLRVSLRGADFLRTLPLRGWRIFLGEILAGPIVLTAIQGFLLALALFLGRGELGLDPRTGVCAWLAGLILLFPLDLLVFTIANGAAVLFPSWVALGPQTERGAEAIGQNILVNLVRYVVLFVGLLPAGGVGGGVAALGYFFLGLGPFALPLGALAAACVLLGEAGILVGYLGGALERFDPSVELR
jgi:hypothetical protein